ncbi:hypothetical protein KDA_04400 [Dictyobacter alpinus]|uniref:Uncharacterized protein n=1 Tax=Dictyobacter alpinus TaxID=2014873 RepID=A0A402B0S8_9CHLR|nr:hypothetical protein [Dictyobacter alpinus]GCE24956.1 hypothetical protein KDA_04400 [Dictyobacter alpinus]
MSHQNYCVTCSKPLKKDEELFHVAAVRRGEDNLKALYVCGQCAPHYEKLTYPYTVLDGRVEKLTHLCEFLDGRTYTDEDAPSRWDSGQTIVHYKKTLITYADRRFLQSPESRGRFNQEQVEQILAECAIDTSQLPPLTDFPLIEDFDIVLVRSKRQNRPDDRFGSYDLLFFSPSRGYLASTLYSPVKSTYSISFDGAFGTLQLPYYDFDLGYKLLLFEDDQFVYVLQGGDWQNDEYDTWFKVDKPRYYERWKNIVQLARDVPAED